MAGGSARAVTFTLNNWSESDYEKIQSIGASQIMRKFNPMQKSHGV